LLALCAMLLVHSSNGSETRQQATAARIACKSKSIQAAFQTRQDCVTHLSKVQPKVTNTPAVQKALLGTLLLLEEIEELLDTEEKILEDAIARGEKQHPEENKRRKRDLSRLFDLIGLGSSSREARLFGGSGNGGLPDLGELLGGLGGGGDNEDEDFSILGLIRTMKETISNLIQNIVQAIFGTIGNAVSGVTELLGIDDILGGNSDNRQETRSGGRGGVRTGRDYFVI